MYNPNLIENLTRFFNIKEFDNYRQERNKSNSLYAEEKNNIQFVVDGIDYSNLTDEKISTEEANFLDRISAIIKH